MVSVCLFWRRLFRNTRQTWTLPIVDSISLLPYYNQHDVIIVWSDRCLLRIIRSFVILKAIIYFLVCFWLTLFPCIGRIDSYRSKRIR